MRPISRRSFLAGSAAVVLAGCSGGSSAPPTTTPTPPETTSGTSAPGTTSTTAVPAPPLAVDTDPFTLGVASGDADEQSVVLWTRLATEDRPLPDDDVEVAWDVARDDAFTDIVASGTTTAAVAHGHSVHLSVELGSDGGAPWRWYRFRVGDWTSPVGRTRTAPPPGDASPVRFASASCQNYQDGYYTAHADIAAQQLDFVVFLGDYIYEGRAAEVGVNEVVRTHGTDEAASLAAYRERYALYKRDRQLQAAHASCPWYVIWDDHEVENNYAGLAAAGGGDPAAFDERRRAAYQAWWEHQPVAIPPPAPDRSFEIHRAVRWGELVDLVLLDGRQHRSDQACGDVGMSLDPPCPETFDPARTMLGQAQEAWLIDRLATSDAPWRVVAQQTVFGDVTLGGAVLNFDQWDGYPGARDRIVGALDPARSTVVLTGDIHFAGTGTIRRGGRGVGEPVGVEFVATSISSGGRVDPAVQGVVAAIPDILDVELEHRGWIMHTVDPSGWSAEYRMVETVKVPDAPMFVHATYRVDAGTNAVRFA